MISALHNDTKAGLLLLLPTITTIPYSLLKTVPCATVGSVTPIQQQANLHQLSFQF